MPVGTRVAVDPCIPCLARGIHRPCANCARGWTSSCLNLDSRVVSSGRTLGFTSDLGGGWAEQVLAHVSMLHPIPDEASDRAACLHEPVSIACHGVLRAPPGDGDPAPRAGRHHRAGLGGRAQSPLPVRPVTVLARHGHQADAAVACGADHVVRTDPGNAHFEELAALVDARVIGRKAHVMLMGGFPYVIEAVGSPQSVTEALRAVAHRGTVLLLGAAGISEVDLTPVWYKEAALVGSIHHTVDAGSAPGLAGGPGPSLGRPGPRRPRRRAPAPRSGRHPRVRGAGPVTARRSAQPSTGDASHAIKVDFRPEARGDRDRRDHERPAWKVHHRHGERPRASGWPRPPGCSPRGPMGAGGGPAEYPVLADRRLSGKPGPPMRSGTSGRSTWPTRGR